jgi:hypothetical protein
MAYRIRSTIGKHFAAPTAIDLTLPDGSKVQLTVQFRHTDVRDATAAMSRAQQKTKLDNELYADAVVSIAGIEDEAGNPVDPVAAVELVKADDWLVSAIAIAYYRAVGETYRQAFAA